MTYPALPANLAHLDGAKVTAHLDDEVATRLFLDQPVALRRSSDEPGFYAVQLNEATPCPASTASAIRAKLAGSSLFGFDDGGERTRSEYLPHPYGVVLRFDELVERFDALAKRARRLGVTEPSFDVVAERQIPTSSPGFAVTVTLIRVVETPPVKHEGWSFVATVDHDPDTGINLIRKAPSAEGIDLPADTWLTASTCDHCGTERKRNETFVVRHDDGQTQRVGRSCLKDFTGHASPGHLVRLVELEWEIASARDLDEEHGYQAPPAQPTIELFLAHCAKEIREGGWTSRAAARDGGYSSTSDLAARQLFDNADKFAKGRRVADDERPTDADHATGVAALAWVRGWDFDKLTSDYRRNLFAACLKSSYHHKAAGLVASAIPGLARETERELARRNRGASLANSEYLGNKGDKLGRKLSKKDKENGVTAHPAWVAEVSGLREFSSDWGVSTLVSLRDEAGNAAAWWASSTPQYQGGREIVVGDAVTVAGTVKKTEQYVPRKEGATSYKQTTLTRVILTEV